MKVSKVIESKKYNWTKPSSYDSKRLVDYDATLQINEDNLYKLKIILSYNDNEEFISEYVTAWKSCEDPIDCLLYGLISNGDSEREIAKIAFDMAIFLKPLKDITHFSRYHCKTYNSPADDGYDEMNLDNDKNNEFWMTCDRNIKFQIYCIGIASKSFKVYNQIELDDYPGDDQIYTLWDISLSNFEPDSKIYKWIYKNYVIWGNWILNKEIDKNLQNLPEVLINLIADYLFSFINEINPDSEN